MKRLGVIGGQGPMATVYFMQRVVEMSVGVVDQDHIEIITHNIPTVPDRTGYILGKNGAQNPGPALKKVANDLTKQGVDVIAMPCNTAHYFYEEIKEGLDVKILHVIKETVNYLKERNISKVGIMATDGTVQTGLFQKEIESAGMEAILPDASHQKLVMDVIYEQVKKGNPIQSEDLRKAKEYLNGQGAEVVILGCTELSVAKRDIEVGAGCIDALDVLAMLSVKECGNLKEEYKELITV